MLEKLINALVGLIEKASEYLEVSTELRRKELGDAPEPKRISIADTQHDTQEPPTALWNVTTTTTEESPEKIAETPQEETPAEEEEEVWWKSGEAAAFLHITPTYLAHVAKEGWIPYRKRNGGRVNEYPSSVFKHYKTLDNMRWNVAHERGTDDKERRWRVVDMMDAPKCCKAYKQGTPRTAHFSRVWGAKTAGILNTYTLMGVEYINLDELGRYTDWWDRYYHAFEKNAAPDFHYSSDPYCVHENDLIWVLTKDYNAQFNPTPEQRKEFERVSKDLPSIQVRGVRYYKADAIAKVERMRKLLSHVEFVE